MISALPADRRAALCATPRNPAYHQPPAITPCQAGQITGLKIATGGHDWCNGCVGNAMAPKIVPSLETVEGLIAEVEEWYERLRKIRQQMTRVGHGSDQDLLSEVWAELDWLKMKAEAAAHAIDEYQDSRPEDD